MSGVVLLRPAGGGASNITISSINGQPVPTFQDTTRNKQLSASDQTLNWSNKIVVDLQWLQIGNAVGEDTGFIADLDGTLVSAVAQCEDTGANNKEIHVYRNATDQGSMGTLGPGTNVSFINSTLDIDFNQGDLIRVRAHGAGTGQIEDTVVKLTIKWRA